MEVIHPRCAGIDVSKRDAKVCVRVQGRGREATSSTVTTWTSMTSSILALREHLIAERVTCVVIESTAAYWKPFYFLLDDALNVMLVNARHVRNVPGRKTDVSDAAWLAELGAHGLVRASFVPPEPIRVLRDLTRARTVIAQARTKEIGRLETLLEDTGIKLSSVACEITGVSGRAMLEALIAGERDPAVLADLARQRMRQKIPALTEALRGRFNDHHAFMVRLYLDRIDAHQADIARLDTGIEEAIAPFQAARELLMSIPGWSRIVADVFIAETGADMNVFPTPAHLASWAGVAPGSNESAGRLNRQKPRPATATSKPPSGSPPCRHRAAPTPTSAPASDASPAADQSEPEPRSRAASPPPGRPPWSRSNTRCSPAPGTCLSTAPSTKTPDPTTTPATNQPRSKPEPPNNSRPSDTT